MDSRWFKNTTASEREARSKELRSYRLAFEALTEVLQKEIKESTPDYDCPSWSHKQADQNGYNRAIQSVLKLIQIKEG